MPDAQSLVDHRIISVFSIGPDIRLYLTDTAIDPHFDPKNNISCRTYPNNI